MTAYPVTWGQVWGREEGKGGHEGPGRRQQPGGQVDGRAIQRYLPRQHIPAEREHLTEPDCHQRKPSTLCGGSGGGKVI